MPDPGSPSCGCGRVAGVPASVPADGGVAAEMFPPLGDKDLEQPVVLHQVLAG
jgi:hypothetical protein